MENETSRKRSLVLLLVIVTVVIFIGLVWLITFYEPWTLLGISRTDVPAVMARVERNCTYPVGYWREHPELYPPEIVVGSRVYKAAEISGTLTGDSEDIGSKLEAQLIAAFLNVLSGADQSLINTTIFQAYDWVVEHPDESQATDGERETGARLSTILEAYNLGQAGVAICADGVAEIVTATSSMTPTATFTGIASETSTLTPTVTPSSTVQPTFPVWTPPQATPTQTSTTQAPGEPPPATSTTAPSATQEPPPAPTNTPIPPTEEPSPTFTLPPEFTLPPPPP